MILFDSYICKVKFSTQKSIEKYKSDVVQKDLIIS